MSSTEEAEQKCAYEPSGNYKYLLISDAAPFFMKQQADPGDAGLISNPISSGMTPTGLSSTEASSQSSTQSHSIPRVEGEETACAFAKPKGNRNSPSDYIDEKNKAIVGAYFIKRHENLYAKSELPALVRQLEKWKRNNKGADENFIIVKIPKKIPKKITNGLSEDLLLKAKMEQLCSHSKILESHEVTQIQNWANDHTYEKLNSFVGEMLNALQPKKKPYSCRYKELKDATNDFRLILSLMRDKGANFLSSQSVTCISSYLNRLEKALTNTSKTLKHDRGNNAFTRHVLHLFKLFKDKIRGTFLGAIFLKSSTVPTSTTILRNIHSETRMLDNYVNLLPKNPDTRVPGFYN